MSDIERDHRFDSDDERAVDDTTDTEAAVDDLPGGAHGVAEAAEADVVDQHTEVDLDDPLEP